jgi:chemotaxis protein CheZ
MTEKSYERGKVVEIIQSVIHKMEGSGASDHEIHAELADLSHIIDLLRHDIAQSHTGNLKHTDIPGATDELDAVVLATAEATNTIMAACEAIEKRASITGDNALIDEVTRIYEACGFQDITGQRISKVVATLRQIETKIDHLLSALDRRMGPIDHAAPVADQRQGDKALLNGPQMPAKAVSQDDIDRLLAEFDN